MSDQANPDVIITIQVKVSVSPSGVITTQVNPVKPVRVKPDGKGKVPYEPKKYVKVSKRGHPHIPSGNIAKAIKYIQEFLAHTPTGVLQHSVAKDLAISDGAVWGAIDWLVNAQPGDAGTEKYERFKDLSSPRRMVGIRIVQSGEPQPLRMQKTDVMFCQKCHSLMTLEGDKKVCRTCHPIKPEKKKKKKKEPEGDDEE